MTDKKPVAEEAPCIRCGELTTERLGGKPICRDCYDIRSSCCQEFGSDDLTTPWADECPDPDNTHQHT